MHACLRECMKLLLTCLTKMDSSKMYKRNLLVKPGYRPVLKKYVHIQLLQYEFDVHLHIVLPTEEEMQRCEGRHRLRV